MALDPLHGFQSAFDRAPAYRAFLAANGPPPPCRQYGGLSAPAADEQGKLHQQISIAGTLPGRNTAKQPHHHAQLRLVGEIRVLALLAEHGLEPLRLLQERGINPDSVRQRPFVLLDGRADGGVAFYGAKIDIARIRATLEETPWLAERLSGEFQLGRGDDAQLQPFLTLAVVLRPDAPPSTESEVANVFADALAIRQKGIYAQLLADDRASALPRVRFVASEEIMTRSGFKIRYLA